MADTGWSLGFSTAFGPPIEPSPPPPPPPPPQIVLEAVAKASGKVTVKGQGVKVLPETMSGGNRGWPSGRRAVNGDVLSFMKNGVLETWTYQASSNVWIKKR